MLAQSLRKIGSLDDRALPRRLPVFLCDRHPYTLVVNKN
jgi:hypothetical protein